MQSGKAEELERIARSPQSGDAPNINSGTYSAKKQKWEGGSTWYYGTTERIQF
jgi:hypothetical protein